MSSSSSLMKAWNHSTFLCGFTSITILVRSVDPHCISGLAKRDGAEQTSQKFEDPAGPGRTRQDPAGPGRTRQDPAGPGRTRQDPAGPGWRSGDRHRQTTRTRSPFVHTKAGTIPMNLTYDSMPLFVRRFGTEMPPITLGRTYVDSRPKS
jgi:hypothetical protein